MTKLSKWLSGTVAAAFMGVMLFVAASALGASDAAAQSPPAPPARFAGSVTVDGQPAAPGTVIRTTINGAACGQDAVFTSGAEARYTIDVPSLEPNAPNCGVEGSTVTFWVGDRQAQQTGTWLNYQLNIVNLTVVTATATATATTTATTTASPTTTATGSPTVITTTTPRPPRTGAGMEAGSDVSAVWLFAALGLGAVAFGAAGVAASRRAR